MRDLKSFEKELNKCSKCGLCQSACPIFEITKNECAVSKGKFTMLHGVTKGDLKLSKNINKYLDMCLKCGKCNNYCPSGIDVCQILSTAKYEFMKNKFRAKILYLMQNLVFKIINKPHTKNIKNQTDIVYFKGCINNFFPNTDKYLHKIFKNKNLDFYEPNFECCGLPYLSEGNLEEFEKVAKNNINKIPNNCKYLITDCASCENTILNYSKYIENFTINPEKLINWGDLIVQKGLKFKYKKHLKVTFHKPCHLKNDDFFEKLMKNCTNVEYIKMDDYEQCCGFAGTFGLKNPKLSKQLIRQKADNIKKTQADYVITTCPSCLAGLNIGLIGAKTKVVSLLEFLAKADEII